MSLTRRELEGGERERDGVPRLLSSGRWDRGGRGLTELRGNLLQVGTKLLCVKGGLVQPQLLARRAQRRIPLRTGAKSCITDGVAHALGGRARARAYGHRRVHASVALSDSSRPSASFTSAMASGTESGTAMPRSPSCSSLRSCKNISNVFCKDDVGFLFCTANPVFYCSDIYGMNAMMK